MDARLPLTLRYPDGRLKEGTMHPPEPGAVEGPLVSCLMVTRGDRPSTRLAIECCRRQTYARRELVVVCAQADSNLASLLAEIGDPGIRLIVAAPATLGELRNRAVAEAKGDILCTWDDDDLSHPRRIELQMGPLTIPEVAATFLTRCTLWWPARALVALTSRRCWEPTMLIRRPAMLPYPSLGLGEDVALMDVLRPRHVLAAVDAPQAYCYVVHGANSCGEPHFERLLGAATARWEGADYEPALATLAADMPVEAYRAQIGGDEGGASR